MSQTNQKDTIERTSRLLLSGWKMLAITCPICNSVLMESRSGDKQCPGCNLPVVSEDSRHPVVESVSASNDQRTNSNLPPRESYDELRKKFDEENKKKDLVSKSIGQKLLSGWTMLEAICPKEGCAGTPLMRENVDGPSVCLSCNDTFEIRNGIVAPVKNHAIEHSKFDEWENKPILQFGKSNNDDSSAKLAEKMLQGWALLDKSCDICHGETPLLRDKNKKLFCVKCGYTDQSVAIKEKPTARHRIESEEDLDDDDDERIVESMVEKIMLNRLNPQRSLPDEKIASSSLNFSSSCSTVENLVLKKMVESANLLYAERDVLEASKLADLVTKLATAAKAVKSMGIF